MLGACDLVYTISISDVCEFDNVIYVADSPYKNKGPPLLLKQCLYTWDGLDPVPSRITCKSGRCGIHFFVMLGHSDTHELMSESLVSLSCIISYNNFCTSTARF